MKINLIIPAAGAATRLRPFTNNTSKVMVRVNGKPCIDYIIEQVRNLPDIELENIVVVHGQFSDIEEYCKRRYSDLNIMFTRQFTLDGPRDAIRLGFEMINTPKNKQLPTVVWLGDAIILDDDLPLGTDFLLCKKDVDDHQNWCMWDSASNSFYDKPSQPIPNGVALVGLYSFSDGNAASESFSSVRGYNISEALKYYSKKANITFTKVNTDQWYDIGDVPSYHDTCAKLLHKKTRAFNRLIYDKELSTLTKFPDFMSESSKKTIRSEIGWYKNLSKSQRCFAPKIIDSDVHSLTMSYESGTLLSDIMMYEDVSESMWDYILTKLFNIKLKHFSTRFSGDDQLILNDGFVSNARMMWLEKTDQRLKSVDSLLLSTSVKSRIIQIAEDLIQRLYPIECMHGDLHFGNIIYDYNSDQLTFIDPRGKYGSSEEGATIGDNLYDWAKLSHDLIHGYNAMIANVNHNETVKKLFTKKLKENDLPIDDIFNGGLVLLASCIPLHYEDPDRQKRFADYISKTIG